VVLEPGAFVGGPPNFLAGLLVGGPPGVVFAGALEGGNPPAALEGGPPGTFFAGAFDGAAVFDGALEDGTLGAVFVGALDGGGPPSFFVGAFANVFDGGPAGPFFAGTLVGTFDTGAPTAFLKGALLGGAVAATFFKRTLEGALPGGVVIFNGTLPTGPFVGAFETGLLPGAFVGALEAGALLALVGGPPALNGEVRFTPDLDGGEGSFFAPGDVGFFKLKIENSLCAVSLLRHVLVYQIG